MSNLMSGCLREVDPDPGGAEGPGLLVVKVQVAREAGDRLGGAFLGTCENLELTCEHDA